MQKPGEDGHPPRFCHLWTQEDLLYGWTLMIEAGVQGSRGRIKRQHYPDWETAEAGLLSARDQQLQRGYRMMIVQGQTPSGTQ